MLFLSYDKSAAEQRAALLAYLASKPYLPTWFFAWEERCDPLVTFPYKYKDYVFNLGSSGIHDDLPVDYNKIVEAASSFTPALVLALTFVATWLAEPPSVLWLLAEACVLGGAIKFGRIWKSRLERLYCAELRETIEKML